jgi:3-methylfumaryl-CoA hydratase
MTTPVTAAPAEAWLGRTETAEDEMVLFPAQAAAATFDESGFAPLPGAPLPPLWHWFYFLAPVPTAGLGADGHPARGGFLPPIALPRRMFAGARLRFHAPLVLGRPARRTSVIAEVREKEGRSGRLAFVTVRHAIAQDDRVCVEEEQDIVYRDATPAPSQGQVPEAAPESTWIATLVPDPVLLFRFSALTFNAHRIHYDQAYATGEEGYPALVVHGPLTAMLLSALVRCNTGRPIAQFAFRGLAPLFAGEPTHLIGRTSGHDRVSLEARAAGGRVAMTAEAILG